MSQAFVKIPEPTLRRLPWYLTYAKIVLRNGGTYLSSTQIAHQIGIDSSKVVKDFSYVNISGKTRVGYNVEQLVSVLETLLGFKSIHKAIMFGVGSLGTSLLLDNGLHQFGFNIVGAFDVNPELIGKKINGIMIHHVDEFFLSQEHCCIEIGMLTVPPEKAQEVANLMVDGGIKAIWNFTPYRIRVPEHVVVQNTSIYAHLALIYNRLNEANHIVISK